MGGEAGKGDGRRPCLVSHSVYCENWNKIDWGTKIYNVYNYVGSAEDEDNVDIKLISDKCFYSWEDARDFSKRYLEEWDVIPEDKEEPLDGCYKFRWKPLETLVILKENK